MKYLFPDFLNGETEYDRASGFWCDLYSQIADSADGCWSEWLQAKYANGTKFLDGDPIFSRWCAEKKKAFKVIQRAPSSDTLEINARMGTFGSDDPNDPDYLEQMTICCELSEESARIAKTLIASWIGNVSFAEMNAIIRRIIPPSE